MFIIFLSPMSGLLPLLRLLLRGVIGEERQRFLESIYADQCVVLSVMRLLGEIEKIFVFKVLLVDRPVKESLFAHWTVPALPGANPKSMYEPSLRNLVDLGIFVGSDSSYELGTAFRTTYVKAVRSVGKGSSLLPTASLWREELTHSSPPRSDGSKWHGVLERIISSTTTSLDRDVDKVTLRLGFGVAPAPPAAYKFILSETREQVWVLVGELVALLEQRGALGGAALAVRTVCGILETAFRCADNTTMIIPREACMRTVEFLQDIDALQPHGEGFRIGPTGQALVMGTEGSNPSSSLLLGARLLVDSNMHVAAYTQSGLQVKLVSLFCKVLRIMGSLVIAVLTRASVQKAIDAGVAAEAIIGFLSQNTAAGIPPNVALQIRLWEADCPRNRLTIEPVVVLSWRGDRNEQASTAISQVRQIAESNRGLLFVKQEADGRVFLGIKQEVAKHCLQIV